MTVTAWVKSKETEGDEKLRYIEVIPYGMFVYREDGTDAPFCRTMRRGAGKGNCFLRGAGRVWGRASGRLYLRLWTAASLRFCAGCTTGLLPKP